MTLNKLQFIRSFVDFLSVTCFLSLFSGWILLGSRVPGIVNDAPGMAFFWYLFFIALFTRYTLAWMFLFLSRAAKLVKKLFFGVYAVLSFSFFAVLMLNPVTALPLEASTRLLFCLVAWLFGIKMLNRDLDSYALYRQLVFGAMNFTFFILLTQKIDIGSPILNSVLPFLLFWLFGIIISIMLNQILEYADTNSVAQTQAFRFWLPFFLFLSTLIVFITLFFSTMLPALLQLLGKPFRALLFVLLGIRDFIFDILILAAYRLSELLDKLLDAFGFDGFNRRPPLSSMAGESGPVDSVELVELMQYDVPQCLLVVVFTLLAVTLAFIILKLRKPQQDEEAVEDFRESFASLSAFKDWGKRGLSALTARLRKPFDTLKSFQGEDSAIAVYHKLLIFLSKRNYKKPGNITAKDFQPSIEKLLQDEARHDAHSLLQAFHVELYAEQTVDQAKVKSLSIGLRNIKKDFRQKQNRLAAENLEGV